MGRAWRLHPNVALREESFGALAYHYDTRRLVCLKSRALVELVASLEQFESADAALVALIPEPERPQYARAMAGWPRPRSSMSPEVTPASVPLRQRFTRGLEAPICLTWELTYACNLACVHCLSSSADGTRWNSRRTRRGRSSTSWPP